MSEEIKSTEAEARERKRLLSLVASRGLKFPRFGLKLKIEEGKTLKDMVSVNEGKSTSITKETIDKFLAEAKEPYFEIWFISKKELEKRQAEREEAKKANEKAIKDRHRKIEKGIS